MGVHDLARVIAGGGCLLVLRAGRLERRGDLEAARRLARAGGFFAALGSAAQAALLAFLAAAADLGAARGASLLLALASGFLALLAGLAGKPRPSGGFAALLWLASLVLDLALP